MNVDDFFWEDLLLYLKEKQVIPIIGQDLLTVEIKGRSVNAYRLMAERLAEELKVSRKLLPQDFYAESGRGAFHPSRPVDLPTQLPGTILFYVLGAVSATGGTRDSKASGSQQSGRAVQRCEPDAIPE